MSSQYPEARPTRGAILAVSSAVGTGAFLLLYREASLEAERLTVVFAMLVCAAIGTSIAAIPAIVSRPSRLVTMPARRWIASCAFFALTTLSGNFALAAALPSLGPGFTGTLMQLQVFVVAIFAWFFLGEGVTRSLLLGSLLAVGGFAFYALGDTGSGSMWGLGAALLTILSFASMLVWTRAVVRDYDPEPLNAARLWMVVIALLAWPGLVDDSLAMPMQTWILCAGAGMSGPVVGRLCVMYALRELPAAKTKLLTMLSPVFAFLFSFAFLGDVPSLRETGGVLLIVAGVLLAVRPPAILANRDSHAYTDAP